MKRIQVLFFISSIFLIHQVDAQYKDTYNKAIVLKRVLEENHIAPKPIDDSLSTDMFNSLIKAADKKGLFFTDAEYKNLQKFSTSLDDELNGKNPVFINQFAGLYKIALSRADSIIHNILQKPFDFTVDESITLQRETTNFNFAQDRVALSSRWKKYLKYEALNHFSELVNSNGSSGTSKPFIDIINENETVVRERISKMEKRAIDKILNYPGGFPEYISQLYLNALATVFDPHTYYFSADEKEDFKSSLSTESLSFGLDLNENDDGAIIIQKLFPGGPAWKSGDLNEGDELVSLQREGEEETTLKGLSIELVYEMITSPQINKLVLKSRKTDGTIKIVSLKKEVMENEENIVKGFVLDGDKKIGYILLPAFYTQWENESGSSCANDVAKEIVKLKKENIEGLILDVRYNGGGSLGEAMEMIGIFINEGPLMGQKYKTEKIVYLKDPNRGTIYSGPLALLVNGQSASASEILAASLQDYNRAVIIGSKTFGKATMQQIMPMDTVNIRSAIVSNSNEMVKITTGKLYRLNGETAQHNGVTPDIKLPDAFDGLNYREPFLPFSLAADQVEKNSYYKPLDAIPLKNLATRSAERIQSVEEFQVIKNLSEKIRDSHSKPEKISLKLEQYERWMKDRKSKFEISPVNSSTSKFLVENHSLDKSNLKNNEYAIELNKEWLMNISQDIYIQEAFFVLSDFINIQNNKK